METLANAMRRENRRFKAPSSSSSAAGVASGRVPLVMAFLSCLAWLYIAGRYAAPIPAQIPAAPTRDDRETGPDDLPFAPSQVVAGRADPGDPGRPPREELRQRADLSSPSVSLSLAFLSSSLDSN
jgi:hypothetical protein